MEQERRKALKSGGATEAYNLQGRFVWQKSNSFRDVLKSVGVMAPLLPGSYTLGANHTTLKVISILHCNFTHHLVRDMHTVF